MERYQKQDRTLDRRTIALTLPRTTIERIDRERGKRSRSWYLAALICKGLAEQELIEYQKVGEV